MSKVRTKFQDRKLTKDELDFGILLQDPLLFPLFFFKDDLTIPEDREDLPPEWRGKQKLSVEQKLMFCDQSDRVLLCTGRKIAKTISLESIVLQLAVINQKASGSVDEALLFTPRENQMEPIFKRIVHRITNIPLFKALCSSMARRKGTIDFRTGLRWYVRIEGTSGTDVNMVGLRAKYILGDELAFGNDICHTSRLQTAMPGCKWRYCGVPNGVRGTPFYRLDQTQEGNSWSKHKYPTTVNPLYKSQEAYQQLVDDYGGENTHDFITQVKGEWGAEVYSSFPPGTLSLRPLPFQSYEFTGHDVETCGGMFGDIMPLIKAEVHQAVLGWDYGYSPDPGVFIFFRQPAEGAEEWLEFLRVKMRRVPLPTQIELIAWIDQTFLDNRLACICTDWAAGIQQLKMPPYKERYEHKTLYSAFQGVDYFYDENGEMITDPQTNKPLFVWRKESATVTFRNAMSYRLLGMDYKFYMTLAEQDSELIEELSGTTERRRASGGLEYRAPTKTRGASQNDHNTDAARMATLAIREVVTREGRDTGGASMHELLAALGWAGGGGGDWHAPWE